MLDIKRIQKDFLFLQQKIHGNSVVFLDTAASAQKPQVVISATADSYINDYANVHRGSYSLSDEVTKKYEDTRKIIQNFIGAKYMEEIINGIKIDLLQDLVNHIVDGGHVLLIDDFGRSLRYRGGCRHGGAAQ